MGRTFEAIDDGLARWIEKQPMFFVATAPRADEGLVNCSPKGMDSFRILGPNEVAWLDLTGSGAETIAHLRENGRICVMFCAFEGPANIVRLQGRGEALTLGSPGFEALKDRFPDLPGARSIIRVEVQRIADACGYAVPLMRYEGERETLIDWAEKKGPEGLEAYRAERNRHSLDGLDAFEPG
jgi:hypothetical protein